MKIMMKNINKKFVSITFVLSILLLVSMLGSTGAWGPCTHVVITQQTLAVAKSTTITKIINANIDWFRCGLMYPDVSVIYYYTNFTTYQGTHNVAVFYNKLWSDASSLNSPQAEAFVLGIGTHMIEDTIAHNIYIPDKIKTTLVQNALIHPTVEAIIEANLIANSTTTETYAAQSFNLWNQYFTDPMMVDTRHGHTGYFTPVEWVDYEWGTHFDGNGPTDQNSDAYLFWSILHGNGFSGSFMGWSLGQQGGALWDLFRGFSNFLKNFIPYSDAEPSINQAKQITLDWYNSGDPSSTGLLNVMGTDASGSSDPTGKKALDAADNYATTWLVAGCGIIGILFFVLLTFWKDLRRKVQPSYAY